MTPFGVQPSLNSQFFPPRRIRNAWLAGDVETKSQIKARRPQLTPRIRSRAWKPPARLPEPVPLKLPISPARRIVKVACLMFGITYEEFLSHHKYTLLVDARQYAAVRLRTELKMSYPKIADVLRRKDHVTIMSLLERASK